jgi:HK97 family phage major capsid protein
MAFPALDEVQGKLADRRKTLGTIFDQAGDDTDLSKVSIIKGDTFAKAQQIKALNDECSDLGKELETLLAVQQAGERAKMAGDLGASESGDGGELDVKRSGGLGALEHGYYHMPLPQGKSIGQLFVESKAYTQRQGQNGPMATMDVDLKTVLTTTAGWTPEVTRSDRLVEFATRPIQVADLFPQTTTTQAAVKYMEETTYTNAAAETAEGAVYPEAALAFTEKLSPVQKIPVFLPATEEQLDDVPRMRGIIENRLAFMVRQRLDLELLVGNGTAPNLRGLLNVVGIQTQAKAGDPVPDAVFKAMVKVNTVGQAMANAIVMNPLDWQGVRLLRTVDGLYIWGNPADAGPERMWGLRVAQAQALTQGTGVVGDFANFSELTVRKGIDVQVSNSHSDFFVRGQLAIRADMRVAIVIYRPTAFCTVTGL